MFSLTETEKVVWCAAFAASAAEWGDSQLAARSAASAVRTLRTLAACGQVLPNSARDPRDHESMTDDFVVACMRAMRITL